MFWSAPHKQEDKNEPDAQPCSRDSDGRAVLQTFRGLTVGACGLDPCSEQWDWCKETAEYFYKEYRECCSGFCRGPHPGWQCNNDSNQCICVNEKR